MRKESAGGLLTFSQVCDPWAQKENWSGAGNNQPRLLLTLPPSCPAAHRLVKLMWHSSGAQLGGSAALLGQKMITRAVLPLLGSPPELCLPCATKKPMSLGTPHDSLCVLGWCALGEHTPANTLLQEANRTGKWISTRKQKPPDNKLWLKRNSLYAKPCDTQNQPNCPSFWSLPGIISTPPGENPPPVFCFQLAPIHSCSKCPTGFF